MVPDPKARGTTEIPSAERPYSRGGPVFRWLYARWRQVLAFFDLLGADGRVSATKLLAYVVAMSVVVTALSSVAVKIILAVQGKIEALADQVIWTPTMFWVLLLCFSVLFGRWGLERLFNVLKDKWSGGING